MSDLNIMENIWGMLSEKVYSDRQFNNKEKLFTSILGAKGLLMQNKKETTKTLLDIFKMRIVKVLKYDGRLIN